MNRSSIKQTTIHRGSTISEALVTIALVVVVLAIALPLLAAASDGSGIAGSKRNLRQLAMAHAMYGADHNGDQWTSVTPHNLAEFGDGYNTALANYIASIGGMSNPMVSNGTGELQTFLGWAEVPDTGGQIGLWRYPWNIYTMPIHLDSSASQVGFGYHRMNFVMSFNAYVGGKVYDRTFFAPKHGVALAAVGECFNSQYDFCIGDQVGHVYWPSYSLSPAALFHPDLWNVPEGEFPESIDAVFAEFDNAFHALPYNSALYPDLKTHIAENVWLQNNYAGPCLPENGMAAYGSYDGCISFLFNASIHSEPVTLFYDGHVRLLPLAEVQQSDEKIGVWRRDTPMGENGYFHDFGVEGSDNPELSHHILTDGGILGRDTLGTTQ